MQGTAIVASIPRLAKRTTSHHRVIRYRLGGLHLMVRSPVDAHLQEELRDRTISASTVDNGQHDWISYMRAASLGTDAPSIQATPEAPGATVVQGGDRSFGPFGTPGFQVCGCHRGHTASSQSIRTLVQHGLARSMASRVSPSSGPSKSST